MRLRLLLLGTMVGVIALLVASCGVPKSGSFQPIPLGNIPEGLTETTTTTTVLETTSTVEFVTTTTFAPVPTTNPTEPVTLYFVAGQQLTSAVQFLPRPVQVQVALAALQAGPDHVVGLRTAIPRDATLKPTGKYRGVLTIDLNSEFFTSMPDPADERLAIGQIVETVAGLSGVGLIRFTINDDPISVPLGNGEQSEPGAPLAIEDYDVLTGSAPPPSSTTTVPGAPEGTTTTSATTSATTTATTTPGSGTPEG